MSANGAMALPLVLAASVWIQVGVLVFAVIVGIAVSQWLRKKPSWSERNTVPGFLAFLVGLLGGQVVLHLAGQLAEMPAWASAAWIVVSIVGAICVSRDCARQEAFEQSYISMGVVGGLVLVAVGSLCPGLVLDLAGGARILVGLGLAVIGVGVFCSLTDRRSDALLPILCLSYVAAALAVFAFRPGLFFGISGGGQVTFLIGVTFVMPLSVGRLLARWLKIDDAAFRIGVVLTALTLGVWPLASQLLIGAAEQRGYSQDTAEHVRQQEDYKVRDGIKQQLEELVPGLTVVHEVPGSEETAPVRSVGSAGLEKQPASSEKPSE